ncbi:PRD domain-containing protein [Sporolactobacillus sp. CQH2019]|uniref:BglG family transcription antiterminator n=1 Tax=Sporolactobacillus sp. CQH2019 TaxID=3023512 RepID=UPI0023684686|nr:PRD domain-containing protein [Sporolactobacillus sp. CQH2019]MDD9147985.1 PRD domain-containing protein [Sporolactobacillus sp. CQH2019]
MSEKLNKALLAIYKKIASHPNATLRELGYTFHKSSRTIRLYIREINNTIDEPVHQVKYSKKSGCYYISRPIISTSQKEQKSLLPERVDERISYLTYFFLTRNNYVKVNDIAEMLHVSPQTITNDLRKVKKGLKKYQLHFNNKPYYGIMISGDEANIREALMDLLYSDRSENHYLIPLIPKTEITALRRIIVGNLTRTHITVPECQYDALICHLWIMVLRTKNGNFLENTFPYASNEISDAAKNIITEIENEFNITFPHEEKLQLNIHLMAKLSLTIFDDQRMLDKIIVKFITIIDQKTGLNLKRDSLFNKDIQLHFAYFLERLKIGLYNRNPLLNEIKEKYAFEFNLVLESLNQVLGDRFIAEDEIGFLALHVRGAIERSHSTFSTNVPSIILVCGAGIGTIRLIETQLIHLFKNKLQIFPVLSKSDFKKELLLNQVDGVISTTPINTLKLPTLFVNPLLTDNDIDKIQQFINNISAFKIQSQKIFCPDYFKISVNSYNNYLEVVHDICTDLKHHLVINDLFEKEILKRELLSSTFIGHYIVIPHPLKYRIERSFIYVNVLKNSVKWIDGQEVKLIFLIGVAKNEIDLIRNFHDHLAGLITNSAKLDKLLQVKNFDEFIKIFYLEK